MLELATCRECGQVKLCISFPWGKGDGITGVTYYCPECDEAIEEFIDRELAWFRAATKQLEENTVPRR